VCSHGYSDQGVFCRLCASLSLEGISELVVLNCICGKAAKEWHLEIELASKKMHSRTKHKTQ
jgi:hypothetical protein